MSEPVDDETAYGHDQDREAPKITAPSGREEDLNPDDFGPETQGGLEVNPSTGVEYGAIDSEPEP